MSGDKLDLDDLPSAGDFDLGDVELTPDSFTGFDLGSTSLELGDLPDISGQGGFNAAEAAADAAAGAGLDAQQDMLYDVDIPEGGLFDDFPDLSLPLDAIGVDADLSLGGMDALPDAGLVDPSNATPSIFDGTTGVANVSGEHEIADSKQDYLGGGHESGGSSGPESGSGSGF